MILDVGAAPGGWSQYAVQRVGITIPCSVISVDLLDIDPIPGVHFIKGDFLDDAMKNQLLDYVDERPVDAVLSDIAPNFTGNHTIDHQRQIEMCRNVIAFAHSVGKRDCTVVLKVFQGSEFQGFIAEMKQRFHSLTIMKPKASHKQSSEVYCIMKHFRFVVSSSIPSPKSHSFAILFSFFQFETMKSLFFVFLVFALTCSEYVYEYSLLLDSRCSGMNRLTRSNLEKMRNDNKNVLVLWYAPDCAKCGKQLWDVNYSLYLFGKDQKA